MTWNTIIVFLYILTFIMIPYSVAFFDEDNLDWIIISKCIDLIFLIEIILTFFKAYYNSDLVLVVSRKKIAYSYITSWFFIDLIAVFPISLISGYREYTSMFRLLKLTKLHKLLKLNKVLRYINLDFPVEVVRLLGFVITFFIFCHIVACIWILIALLEDENGESEIWLDFYQLYYADNVDIYITAYYFVITTFSSVGYGDITPQTSIEKVFVMIMEIIGFITFSYAMSSMITIVEHMNRYDNKLRKKLDILEDINRECNIGPGLFDITRQNLVYQANKDKSEVISLIQGLPHRLRVELSSYVMQTSITSQGFFKDQSKEFLAFIIPRLQAYKVSQGMFIFREGEVAQCLYILLKGKAAYSLEGNKYMIYMSVKPGNIFGTNDFVRTESDKSGKYRRKFTVLAVTD